MTLRVFKDHVLEGNNASIIGYLPYPNIINAHFIVKMKK